MGSETVYEELDEAKAEIENLKENYKIKLELSESLKRSNDEQLIKFQEAVLKIEKLSEEVNEKGALLEEANVENEKLRENYQMKVEFSESLRRSHDEQLIKNQEAGFKIEKFSQELNEKIEEISLARQKYEELELKLKEKDALVKHVSALNDKLRVESNEKIAKCEEENLQIGLALEEASANNMQQEEQLQSFQEEIQRFKGLASVSNSSYSKARSQSFNEERLRDDILHKIEDEKRKYEHQLKWKKEQFNHLQEAHEKLRSDLKVRQSEWETEKASLLDELSNLQTKLDSQIRLSESLKSRLEMCNNALSHAESKRKILEAELSESRKYEEVKPIIENLTGERDIEIAGLRCSLGEKENLYKEMENQVRMLEQEKKDLLTSLKELQEAQIHGKLRNKTKGLEHVHKDCSERLKSDESDWNSQMENLSGELDCCNSELDSKIQLIDKLKQEAETRDSVIIELAMNNEEAAIMFLVLKSELSDAIQKFVDACSADLAQNDEEHKVSLLIKLLDAQKIAVKEAQKQVEVERMKVAELTGMIASANSTETPKQVEVERMEVAELTGMIASANSTAVEEHSLLNQELGESNAFQCELKKHNNTMEDMLNEARTALQRTNEELDMNFCEATELDFELQVWKSIAQQLKLKIEEEHRNRRKEVTHTQMLRLKTQVKKLRRAMDKANEELAEKFCEGNEVEFQLQIWKSIAEQLTIKLEENHHLRREMEASLLSQTGLELSLKQEKDNLSTLIEEKDDKIKSLEQELILLSEELEGAILAQVDAEKNYEHEKEILQQQVAERDQEFESSMIEMQKEMDALHEGWEEVAASALVKDKEIQEKNLIVNDIDTLQQQVEERDQRIENLQQTVKSLEQEFESSTVSFSSKLSQMQLEINSFHQAWDEVATTVIMKEMEIQEQNLIVIEMENMLKLSSERLNQIFHEDFNLSERLGYIMQAFDDEDSTKENRNMVASPLPSSKADAILDERLPFRAINN